jgi:hypothetical protein
MLIPTMRAVPTSIHSPSPVANSKQDRDSFVLDAPCNSIASLVRRSPRQIGPDSSAIFGQVGMRLPGRRGLYQRALRTEDG